MRDLLPHYERELAFLRRHAGEFARQNPKIAGRLLLGDDAVEDPHVQRLIESFALIASRIHKRLDDDFPVFTESLLDVLYPDYLRPFPSCGVACFPAEPPDGQKTASRSLPRGTSLRTRPVRGVECDFRTAYDLHLAPLRIESVSIRHGVPRAIALGAGGQASTLR